MEARIDKAFKLDACGFCKSNVLIIELYPDKVTFVHNAIIRVCSLYPFFTKINHDSKL
jgi:hypothetical protein